MTRSALRLRVKRVSTAVFTEWQHSAIIATHPARPALELLAAVLAHGAELQPWAPAGRAHNSTHTQPPHH